MTPLRALTLACLLAAPLVASAQWMYLDKDGRKVFSDKAPPPDTPAKNILKQPGARSFTEAAAPAAAPAGTATAATAPKVTGKDKELEEKRVKAESADAEKKKAEAEQHAKARAENCALAKSNKATLDSGVRLVRANEKGEREVLDDKQRAAEMKRVEAVIASDCKPAGQ